MHFPTSSQGSLSLISEFLGLKKAIQEIKKSVTETLGKSRKDGYSALLLTCRSDGSVYRCKGDYLQGTNCNEAVSGVCFHFFHQSRNFLDKECTLT